MRDRRCSNSYVSSACASGYSAIGGHCGFEDKFFRSRKQRGVQKFKTFRKFKACASRILSTNFWENCCRNGRMWQLPLQVGTRRCSGDKSCKAASLFSYISLARHVVPHETVKRNCYVFLFKRLLFRVIMEKAMRARFVQIIKYKYR